MLPRLIVIIALLLAPALASAAPLMEVGVAQDNGFSFFVLSPTEVVCVEPTGRDALDELFLRLVVRVRDQPTGMFDASIYLDQVLMDAVRVPLIGPTRDVW